MPVGGRALITSQSKYTKTGGQLTSVFGQLEQTEGKLIPKCLT